VAGFHAKAGLIGAGQGREEKHGGRSACRGSGAETFTGCYASGMDVLKMLAELREERAQIEEAIMAIEHLASGRGKRRGRPPAWMTAYARGAR